jgi:hypothetical protein
LQPESIWTAREKAEISGPGKRKIGRESASTAAGGSTADAVSLRCLRHHPAHRLGRREIDAASHPPAARQLTAWQENRQDNAWIWHKAT